MCQPFQHQRAYPACACLGGKRPERVNGRDGGLVYQHLLVHHDPIAPAILRLIRLQLRLPAVPRPHIYGTKQNK